MRNILARRSAAFAGTVCALLLGISGVANADDPIFPPPNPIYSNPGPVTIRVGGVIPALYQCLDDTRDGVINSEINWCDQIHTADGYVEFQDVNLVVVPVNTWGPSLFRGKSVDVWISGSYARGLIECIADASDRVIDNAAVQCTQSALGNMFFMSVVGIYVYQ